MDDETCIPLALRQRMSRNVTHDSQNRYRKIKTVLDRLILGFADQQLVTGIALLVAGGIKSAQEPGFLGGAHASLIVALACLSSSSHLAGLLNIRPYLTKHRALATLRIVSVAVFAIFLSIGLLLTNNIISHLMKLPMNLLQIFQFGRASIGLPNLLVLYTFWLAFVQILDGFKHWIRRKVRIVVWRRVRRWIMVDQLLQQCRRFIPERVLSSVRRAIKNLFWFILLGDPLFVTILQILFAGVAAFCALTQKFAFAGPPLCDLTGREGNKWGFGQLLAMLLLLLPLLQAAEGISGLSARFLM